MDRTEEGSSERSAGDRDRNSSSRDEGPEEGVYSFAAMEAKWPQVWEDLKVFTPVDDGSARAPLCPGHVPVPFR